MIKMEITGLKGALSQFGAQDIKRGLRSGLNKVGNSVRTLSSAKIREEYNLKKSDVDKTFSITATPDQVVIRCQGRPINLTLFNARQFGASGGRRVTTRRKGDTLVQSTRGKAGSFGGVAVQITRGATTLLPGAFLAKVKAGNKGGAAIGVFQRKGDKRLPILNKAMVSVPTLFLGKRVMPSINDYLTGGKAVETIVHEVKFSLGLTGPP